MKNRREVEQAGVVARHRIARSENQVRQSIRCAAEGNPLAAEVDPRRLIDRLMAKNGMTVEEAEATALGVRARTPRAEAGPEAIWGSTIDFVGVAFLERGRRAARAVARVATRSGQGLGSGFLIGDRLFMTNHHVLPSREAAAELCAEFDFELDTRDNPLGRTSFAFDASIFVTDSVEGLDYSIVGIGERLGGVKDLADYGFCPLSDAADKHAIGEVVNIVQHPRGRYKEVVLRENRIAARDPLALLYVADTEPGSSGSPVFNNQWQPIALHHWGGPYRFRGDDNGTRVPRTINEGIRISAIVKTLRERVSMLSAVEREALQAAIRAWEAAPAPDEETHADQPTRPVPQRRSNPDGSTSWFFPLEITVRAPLADMPKREQPAVMRQARATNGALSGFGEAALEPSDDFSDRAGYEPGFIPGHVVPLPRLGEAQRNVAARNLEAHAGEDPFELPYHHFSIAVNAQRKLAFFTACNIDGRRSKYVNRKDGTIAALDPHNPDHGLMERLGSEGAEASESWYDDRRLAPDDIAGKDTYAGQIVPGFPDTRSMGRTLRMFQRGHLVRRLDPCWGTNQQARLAEADTFFFTNCSPQVGFFNMGRASSSLPGTGGGKLWRAVENMVLRNARNERMRVSSFTGPIFDDDEDRQYRNIRIPGRFFKIVVWAEDGQLKSLAMIADQRPVLDVWPEALFENREYFERLGEEAFQDADELDRVDDFLTTLENLEHETGLDFGEAVRAADVRRGESAAMHMEIFDLGLLGSRFRSAPPRGGRSPRPRAEPPSQPA